MFRREILKLMNDFSNLKLNMSDDLAQTLVFKFKMIKLFNEEISVIINILLIIFKTEREDLKKNTQDL